MKLEIAKRLYDYRKMAGLSQEQVAAKIQVSRQAVSKWECAESSPDTDNLIALALLYGVTVDELLFADPENTDSDNTTTNKEANEEPSSSWQEAHASNKDYVNINLNDGIHVRDHKKGEEVHIDWNGIHVDNEDEHVHLDFEGLAKIIRSIRKGQEE
ncbi:helix-turn-helix domain-containing protein [Atopobium fossor]|uniref:helix-turn-helix domain-containing protein n=1 Tax=Atopobium fossor TaxID=39487 RepID=UPI00040FDAA6|nr:helix-turn-helix domain-containing protein [Atopobium fossor]